MALRARRLGKLMLVAERMEQRAHEEDEVARWHLEVAEGQVFYDAFLAVAHDDPAGGVAAFNAPTGGAFRFEVWEWEDLMLRTAETLRVEDPDWYTQWPGPKESNLPKGPTPKLTGPPSWMIFHGQVPNRVTHDAYGRPVTPCAGSLIVHTDGTVVSCTNWEAYDCAGLEVHHEGEPLQCLKYRGRCDRCETHT
jgi:hypothetical protein